MNMTAPCIHPLPPASITPHTTTNNASWVSASLLNRFTGVLADPFPGLFSNSVEDEVIVSGSFPESNPFGRECGCGCDLPRVFERGRE